MKPQVITDPLAWRELCAEFRAHGSLGFVPTMGALHQGHAELVKRSASENLTTLVSIFVNPTQFDDPKDLRAYPVHLEQDLELLSGLCVQAVFAPEAKALYPDDYRYRVSETRLSSRFCGMFRPGHFDGVLTVVLKLLLLTEPDVAYFGEKDYQQYRLVQGLAEAFFLRCRIQGCPTVREASGLALSSRNARLSEKGRTQAAALYKALSQEQDRDKVAERLGRHGFEVEYVEDMPASGQSKARRLAAVRFEGVRLIDNVPLGAQAPCAEPYTEARHG